MLASRDDEAMLPSPATHLLHRLRHALELAVLTQDCVWMEYLGGLSGASSRLRSSKLLRQDLKTGLETCSLSHACHQLPAGGYHHIEGLGYGVVSIAR